MKPSPAQKQPPAEAFSPREIGVARKVVSSFLILHPTFRGHDFEDLLQECLLHWLARRHLYRPGLGASPSTFMGKILRRKLLDILDEEMTHKRRVNQIAEPLEPPPDDDPEDGSPAPPSPAVPSEIPRLQLRLAVEGALAALHPDQVKLCELLKEGKTVTEIAQLLQKPRPTIYDELKRIREIFHREGLHDFL